MIVKYVNAMLTANPSLLTPSPPGSMAVAPARGSPLPSRQRRPEDRREHDPDGVVLPEERDGDPGEPQRRFVVLREVPAACRRRVVRQDLLHPDEPRERSRDQEQLHLDG